MSLASMTRTIGRAISAKSPQILTAMAVAGVATTAFFTHKAAVETTKVIGFHTIRSEAALDNKKEYTSLSNKELVQQVWQFYIPAAAMGAATILCIIGSNTISSRRSAALMSIYSLTETAFREYQDEVVEEVGKNKEQKIRDTLAQKKVSATSGSEVIVVGNGDVLCFDSMSGRYFAGTVEKIRKAQNDINEMILNGDGYASLNEFHELLGLKQTPLGEALGWAVENILDVNITTTLSEEGVPCLSVEYRSSPREDYFRLR